MVIISGWAGVSMPASAFFRAFLHFRERAYGKRQSSGSFWVICADNQLSWTKNYGATWCYDSFHSSFFLSMRSGWSAIYAYSQPAPLFWFSGCWQMHVKRLYHRIKPGYQSAAMCRAALASVRALASFGRRYVWDNRDVMWTELCFVNGDVYWWFGSV